MARGTFQFTEQFGFDLGGQAFIGDNAEWKKQNATTGNWEGQSFNSLWTIFAGLRFNFNDAVAVKGIFYHQKAKTEHITNNRWEDYGYGIADGNSWQDDANHWAAIIDVKQEALKYTSLWLEYGQYKKGFTGRNDSFIFYSDLIGYQTAPEDIKYWRIGADQEWNEKWTTYLFYYGYDIDFANSRKPKEFGLGVSYKLNDSTTFGLNYMHADADTANDDKDNVVRFRTKVTF